MSVGFDFGTTNSLISVVVGDRVINIVDEDGLPISSVVRYDGEKVVVGREAKEALDSPGLGVHGNTVRSPKFLLGEESIFVGGIERSPIDVVNDVVKFVKNEAMQSQHSKHLGGVERAVVTIPITMNGPKRAALRDAFRRADIGIVQFVHEPLAALYGFVRGHDASGDLQRSLNHRNVLVVDWGGGTLDLTLCRIEGNQVSQIRNGGSAELGGDQFDAVIRDEVVRRASIADGVDPEVEILPEARLRLLHSSEMNKIELSSRDTVTFYRPSFFGQQNLNYRMSRDELEEITKPLIDAGMSEVASLLESAGFGPSQISLCLVAGGMASMPSIRGRLNELFGPQRVVVPRNSGTLVSEGAAWIAHDSQQLHLAKSVELQLSRGSFLTLVKSGTKMPSEKNAKRKEVKLYCSDPTDGYAKLDLCTPSRLSTNPQNSEPRTSLGYLMVGVDPRAKLFQERIELEIIIDDDLILTATVKSSDVKDIDTSSFFDLEFGLELPIESADEGEYLEPLSSEDFPSTSGDLLVRANVVFEPNQKSVPGEVLFRQNRNAFDRSNSTVERATDQQFREYLYYQPCAVCGRSSSDTSCRCDRTN